MRNMSQFIVIMFLTILTCACQAQVKPKIVPAVEVKIAPKHPLGVIGAVEPIYFPPMKTPFLARIDTGATTSSIDVQRIRSFERDGEKWVGFDLINAENREVHHFEKKIETQISIKRINESEKRIIVTMDVKLGTQIFNAQFSLADRNKFEYQALIGRNILNGRAIVDSSVTNTLH